MRNLKKIPGFLRRHWSGIVKYYRYHVVDTYSDKPWALVYTMGKVGSSTILNSLGSNLKNYYTFHIHWLNERNLKTDKNFYKAFFKKNRKRGMPYIHYPDYIIQGFYLNDRLKNLKNFAQKEIKIITLTREPVSRNISSFFQNVELFFDYNIKDRLIEKNAAEVADELILLFKNRIQLPEWYLDKMYSSKYTRHFYSDKEIRIFQSKWIRQPGHQNMIN